MNRTRKNKQDKRLGKRIRTATAQTTTSRLQYKVTTRGEIALLLLKRSYRNIHTQIRWDTRNIQPFVPKPRRAEGKNTVKTRRPTGPLDFGNSLRSNKTACTMTIVPQQSSQETRDTTNSLPWNDKHTQHPRLLIPRIDKDAGRAGQGMSDSVWLHHVRGAPYTATSCYTNI